MYDFTGKTAIVTGGALGVVRQAALARSGASAVIGGWNAGVGRPVAPDCRHPAEQQITEGIAPLQLPGRP